MELLNLSIGILGLVLSFVGFYFTYISFVNPIHRFKRYLKNTEGWERFSGTNSSVSIYRYKEYPTFQIVIDWDNPCTSGFTEEWIMDYPFRDNTNHSSYYVRLETNGAPLQIEIFVSLDGHRYFVPVPRIQGIMEGQRYFYYDKLQIHLAKIIGKFDYYKNIYEFVGQQKFLTVSEI